MSEFATLPLFKLGGVEYHLSQFLAWAEYVEFLTPILEHLFQTEEAVQSSFEIDQTRVQQAVNEFRYHHNLITSAETHNWLTERQLQLDDLYTHIYRKLCDPRRHLRLTPQAWKKRSLDPYRDVWAELHFSGQFRNLFDDFVLRIAIASLPEYQHSFRELPLSQEIDYASAVFVTPEILPFLVLWEQLFHEYVEKNAPRTLCETKLRTYRLDLLKIYYEAVSYRDIHAAKEAYCCLRFDGESPASLAQRTGVTLESEYAFIEDIPELLRGPLLSAKAGECLEPLRITPQKGYTVIMVIRKTEPHINNIQVRERLERKIVREILVNWIDQNIEWFV